MNIDRAMGPHERASYRHPAGCAPAAGAARIPGGGSWRALLVLVVLALVPATAAATPVQHVVAKGETLGSLAKRYGTTVKTIEQVNGLKPARHLFPGQKLLVPCDPGKTTSCTPPSQPPPVGPGRECRGRSCAEDEENEPDEGDAPWVCSRSAGGRVMALPRPKQGKAKGKTSHERKPAKPGYVSLLRYGETYRGQLVDGEQRVVPSARDRISHLLRDLRANKERPMDDRLLKLLAKVSDHFGGRTVVVVSGYREYSPRQHTRSSRHNVGQAIDFRIVGVPVDVVWEYCLELGGVGVGYYPTSSFVHLDVRGYDAAWVDTSRPGERPTYACRPPRSEVEADERRATSAAPRPATARREAPATGGAAVRAVGNAPSCSSSRAEGTNGPKGNPKTTPSPTTSPRRRSATAQSS